ncbi:MAG: septum formation protein Maf [Clostridia bacterium]|nr:septum formation protein Maf [Clostridia bacterium]
MKRRIFLASASPRRRELLGMLFSDFEILRPEADETSGERDPAALVTELSLRKARAGREILVREGREADSLIIAADTVVFCAGQILGKPQNAADAERMLRLLSGRRHEVYTGLTVLSGGREVSACEESGVLFSPMEEAEIAAYARCGEPDDKAGAYAVQGKGAAFVRGIEGSYHNVMGLPVERLYRILKTSFAFSPEELIAPEKGGFSEKKV